MCVLDDQVLDAVKVETYNGYSIMIKNIKFCHKNSNKFVVTQFDCTILLYDLYQVSKFKFVLNILFVYYVFFFFTERSTKHYFQ